MLTAPPTRGLGSHKKGAKRKRRKRGQEPCLDRVAVDVARADESRKW